MSKQIPKYVQKMLERRERLTLELSSVCSAVDDYCKKIGIDLSDTNAALVTDIKIYCEPWTARDCTERAILEALNREVLNNE